MNTSYIKRYGVVFFLALTVCFLISARLSAQTGPPAENDAGTAKIKPVVFDGALIAGYVDKGAFVNCTGPGMRLTVKSVAFMLGMLPSLRIKEDEVAKDQPKNASVTPTLGAGLTFSCRHFALQLPLYYNAKTAASNGKWKTGVGIGYRF
ncbi:hypothetical protein [Compostibacter hankyongensis]|uniref:Outer membrane protein beta-barrel domain-containing protein n=1 Tax=Compostibacter hankyongensis TaxID=1007089 RepID=A0ABP8FL39_9BACT